MACEGKDRNIFYYEPVLYDRHTDFSYLDEIYMSFNGCQR
jgi:hypothetical protein